MLYSRSQTSKKAVLLNDTSYEFHHGCELVIGTIIELLRRQGIQITSTNPVNVDWRENPSFLAAMEKADLVVVNGEGSLHHAKPRAARLITVAEHVRHKLHIPTVLINATCQENGPELTAKMKFFTRIYVRENFSLRDLGKAFIPSTVVPDLSFYSRYDLDTKPSPTGKIGATDSVYPEVSEFLYRISRSRNYSYLPTLCDIKLKKNGSNLFPYLAYHAGKKLDFIRYRAGAKLKHKKIKRFFYLKSYRQYIQAIASLNFLLAGRFHALCFALKTLTPFIAIPSNSHKMEGLISDIGLDDDRLKKPAELEHARFREFSQAEKDKIREYITSAPLKIERMFRQIRELVD